MEQLIQRMGDASQKDGRVSLEAILKVVGRRAFGPFLLLAGLVTLAPVVGDIPGVPTMMGLLVLLVAGQLLLRREYVWLPKWLLKRSVENEKYLKALEWLKKPARWIDRLLRPRLTYFTQAVGIYVTALLCTVIASAMPAMELVPFSANLAGGALTLFGLALIAHDGLLAALGFASTATIVGLVIYTFL